MKQRRKTLQLALAGAAFAVCAALPAVAQQKIVLKASDVHPAGYPTVEAIVSMGKKLEAATNGSAPNSFTGEVLTQTFLGPVTRLKVTGSGTNLIADMSTARAAALPVGARVVAKIPSEGAKLISLPDDGPGLPVLDPDNQ